MVKKVDNTENKQNIDKNNQEIPKRLRTKKDRIPMYKRKRLKGVALTNEKDYHYHCFTDKDGNVERALEAGYQFVDEVREKGQRNAQEPSRFGRVFCQDVGNGQIGYTMRIPKEWYVEDQAAKQKRLDEKDRVMGRDRLPDEARHLYRGGVKVDHSFLKEK